VPPLSKKPESFTREQAEDAQKRLTQYVTLEGFSVLSLGQVNAGFVGPDFGDAQRSEAQGGDGRAGTGAK